MSDQPAPHRNKALSLPEIDLRRMKYEMQRRFTWKPWSIERNAAMSILSKRGSGGTRRYSPSGIEKPQARLPSARVMLVVRSREARSSNRLDVALRCRGHHGADVRCPRRSGNRIRLAHRKVASRPRHPSRQDAAPAKDLASLADQLSQRRTGHRRGSFVLRLERGVLSFLGSLTAERRKPALSS